MLPTLGSTFAFTVWVAARLLLVHASTTDNPTIPDVRLFLDALREMGKLWQTAERYASIIQRVVDELLLSQSQAASPSNGGDGTSGRSCVSILADMRMTSYAVDVMISRQPDLRQQRAQTFGGGGESIPSGNGQVVGSGEPGMPPNAGNGQGGGGAYDFVDVFSWFNFPRVAGDPAAAMVQQGTNGGGMFVGAGGVGGEEADWLFQV
jgi:hypothetical protein